MKQQSEDTNINSLPKDVIVYNFSILFGLISFSYLLEDRRPDLEDFNQEHEPEIRKLGYKYKHTISVKFFHKKIKIITRSLTPGSRWTNA